MKSAGFYTTNTQKKPGIYWSSLLFRIAFAAIVSWLLFMAFFATNALSH